MAHKKSAILSICFFCIVFLSHAQNEQAQYLSAKEHLKAGSYSLAMASFQKLSDPNAKHDFVQYASFYYGLAAYKNGDLALARSMWLQMEKKYSSWNRMKEVYFWLAQVYFDEENYAQGIKYAKQSRTAQEQNLIYKYISEVTVLDQLQALNDEYPDDKIIAVALANRIVEQPLSQRDFKKLEQISNQFNLDQSIFGLPDIGHSITKKTYNVAVLLPFMFEGLDNIKRVSRNKFVMDLYEGIIEARDSINSGEVRVNVFPYDTERSAKATRKIINRAEIQSMDLIIGPLFPEPSKVVSDFCFESKINMINPVSSNSEVINNNPYSFLFKPSTELTALAIANHTVQNVSNKNAFIFFDNTEKDSIAAYTYKEKIVDEGFDVIQCLKLDSGRIADAHELLVNLYEVGLDEEQRDSILLIDENLVKEKKIKMEDNLPDSILYYQEFFSIEADSIGHVFVSSSKPLHASSFISAIEIRPDTIPIMTNGPWMDFEMITFDQIERLAIKFGYPDFMDFNKNTFKLFRQKILDKYKKEPTINNFIGYDLMYYTGQMMIEHGNYFQKGAIKSGFVKGQIFQGFNYSASNSNRYVPIVTFQNSELININDQ